MGAHTSGREGEQLGADGWLTRVQDAIEEALAGRSTLALAVSSGEGGGPEVVLERLAELPIAARMGTATCAPPERRLAYLPLARALQAALDRGTGGVVQPVVDEILAGESRTTARADAPEVDVLEKLVSLAESGAPLVLALAQVQEADAMTLAALSYLHRRCLHVRLAIVAIAHVDDDHVGRLLRSLQPTALIRLPSPPADRRTTSARGRR